MTAFLLDLRMPQKCEKWLQKPEWTSHWLQWQLSLCVYDRCTHHPVLMLTIRLQTHRKPLGSPFSQKSFHVSKSRQQNWSTGWECEILFLYLLKCILKSSHMIAITETTHYQLNNHKIKWNTLLINSKVWNSIYYMNWVLIIKGYFLITVILHFIYIVL